MDWIYFDNNATTRVAPEVLEVMMPFFKEKYGNPSSMHSFGGQLSREVKKAREQVSSLLCASPEEIVFTSGGTESDNFAIRGVLEANPGKKHIITTRVEHPAVRNLAHRLNKSGYALTELSVNEYGELDLDELRRSLRDDTAVVSIMYANNETGVIFPVEEAGEIVKERGAIFHVDAVQAVGKLPIDLSRSSIDILSLSGHKIHATKGIGALYIRRGTRIEPLIVGGHQEKERRGGTENVASMVGLGKACEMAKESISEENRQVKMLRDRLEKELLAKCKDSRVNGHREKRLPNTLNISFKFIEGEAFLLLLNQHKICASSGSACTSGSLEPSHVLRAMGVPFTYAHGSIRFSLSRYNTEAEIDKVVQAIPEIVQKLEAITPFKEESDLSRFTSTHKH